MPTGSMAECARIDEQLDRQVGDAGASLSEEARGHIETCQRCRSLYEWMRESSFAIEDPTHSQSKIRDSLNASLAPVRPLPSIRILVLQFAIAFLLVATPAAAFIGIAGLHVMDLSQLVAVSVVAILGAGLVCLSLAWQMTPGSLHRYSARVVAPLLLAGFLLAIGLLFPWRAPEAFVARGWHCLKSGLLMSAPAGLLFWLLARRGAALRRATAGATLGAIAGLVSVTVLQVACPYQDLGHLLVWHGPILAISIMAGAGIGYFVHRLRQSAK